MFLLHECYIASSKLGSSKLDEKNAILALKKLFWCRSPNVEDEFHQHLNSRTWMDVFTFLRNNPSAFAFCQNDPGILHLYVMQETSKRAFPFDLYILAKTNDRRIRFF